MVLNARSYCCYFLSYRDLEAMRLAEGTEVDHSPIYHRILKDLPELDKPIPRHLKPLTNF
ncbi:MAG: hypothetical protein HC934_01795 [Acaryochloridaceae cyanobacterium SU_2_1]|nr:hypothetical protein [Acaryochloridaceae cyanobacterium SU_2_1]